jgi:hypothetical protein
MRIIYPNGSGVSVIIPSPFAGLTVEQIASKDVPAGVPYLIVQDADVPTDRTQRDLWTADFSSPDGVGIGAEAWFAQNGGG